MTNTLLALAINRLHPLKAREKTMLWECVDSEQFYRSLNPRTLSSIVGRQISSGTLSVESTLRAAQNDHRVLCARRIEFVTFWDERYPAPLREIYDPPFLLFHRGPLPSGAEAAIAVVGTREPGAAAVGAAERLAAELAGAGHAVISGLARGIDAASHRGALRSAVRGSTGAVLGCGIDRICPSSHRGLAAQILDAGGFIASEYSPGTPSAKYTFPARNRIISGMSRGVVVVQAPARSGALITADYALDQGRDLFVHREGLAGPVGAGTRELADDGARIVESARDVFEEWGVVPAAPDLRADTSGGATLSSLSTGPEVGLGLAEQIRRQLALEEPGV